MSKTALDWGRKPTVPVLAHITVAAALLVCAALTCAHQPYESNAVVLVEHDHLELIVTTSAEIAGLLVGDTGDAAKPGDRHAQLLNIAGGLYEVSANNEPMLPENSFFTERGGEAVFSIIYPVAIPAALRFRAAYLDKLPPGYGGSIEVFDESRKLLDRQPLLKKGEAKDTFSIQLPVIAPPPVSAPSPAAAASQLPSPAAPKPVSVMHEGVARLPIIVGILVPVLFAGGILLRLRKPTPTH